MIEKIASNKQLHIAILLVLPFIFYCNTLRNNYALDDSIVITENNYVQKGISGLKQIFLEDTFTGFFKKKKDLVEGGRYRPLSLATFAFEKSIFGNNPHVSHLINIILYSLLCLCVYFLLTKVIFFLAPSEKNGLIAFLAALIFAIHPIHSEVVANIKGRDEILALLFSLLSLYYFIKYLESPLVSQSIFCGIFLFLGLLSKENALIMLPVAFGLVYLKNLSVMETFRLKPYLIPVLASLFYVLLRYKVTGGYSTGQSSELMNNPFLLASADQKIPTILLTLLLYIKLLFIPYPLTFDYYPFHIAYQSWASGWVWLSLIIYLSLFYLSYRFRKSNKLIPFSIFFFMMALLPVSNLFLNIGTFMNERFIFFGSLGFSLISGYLISRLFLETLSEKSKRTSFILLIGIISISAIYVIRRNTCWKDNFTLFLHDVKISGNSAKGNCMAGGILLETAQITNDSLLRKNYLEQSVSYLEKSVQIYSNYVDALLLLGNAYYYLNQDFARVNSCYSRLFNLAPGYSMALDNLNKMLLSCNDAQQRIFGFKEVLKFRPSDYTANYQLGVTYGKMLKQLDSAIFYFEKALKVNPKSKELNRDLGVAYAMIGNTKLGITFLTHVLEFDPNDPSNYINLGVAYQSIGNRVKAKELFDKAEDIRNVRKAPN